MGQLHSRKFKIDLSTADRQIFEAVTKLEIVYWPGKYNGFRKMLVSKTIEVALSNC